MCPVSEDQSALADRLCDWIRRFGLYFILVLFLLHEIRLIVRPFWFDEVLTYTLMASRRSLADIYAAYEIPNNHIFFTILLKLESYLLETLGIQKIMPLYRLPSLCCAIAVIVLFYRFLVRRCGKNAAFCGTLLLAFSPPFLQFSAALRGYMTSFLLILLVMMEADRQNQCGSGWKSWLRYSLYAVLAVGTVPSNLSALLLIALLFAPDVLEKRRWGTLIARFAVPVLALIVYLPIRTKFLNCAALSEGWFSRPGSAANLYLSFSLAYLPILASAAAGVIRKREKIIPVLIGLTVFLAPCIVILCMPKILFPRIFFPCMAVWAFLFVLESRTILASGKMMFLCLIWCTLCLNLTIPVSDALFGKDGFRDDLIAPYHQRPEFQPAEVMNAAAQARAEHPGLRIFLTFDSDYQSLIMSSFCVEDQPDLDTILLYDRPLRPKLTEISGDPLWIVCRNEDDLAETARRFGLPLSGFRRLDIPGLQQVYWDATAESAVERFLQDSQKRSNR